MSAAHEGAADRPVEPIVGNKRIEDAAIRTRDRQGDFVSGRRGFCALKVPLESCG